MEEYDSLFKELTEITGQKTEDFDGVQDIYSTLLAEVRCILLLPTIVNTKSHCYNLASILFLKFQEGLNLTLPAWTKNFYPDKMYEPTVLSYIFNAYNDEMNRLKGGTFC